MEKRECPKAVFPTAPDGRCYQVSTIWRQSSALHCDSWYFETMAFRLNEAKRACRIVGQGESSSFEGAERQQARLVARVEAGTIEQDNSSEEGE